MFSYKVCIWKYNINIYTVLKILQIWYWYKAISILIQKQWRIQGDGARGPGHPWKIAIFKNCWEIVQNTLRMQDLRLNISKMSWGQPSLANLEHFVILIADPVKKHSPLPKTQKLPLI